MNWSLEYLPEAEEDLRGLDGSVMKVIVISARSDDEVYRLAQKRRNEKCL